MIKIVYFFYKETLVFLLPHAIILSHCPDFIIPRVWSQMAHVIPRTNLEYDTVIDLRNVQIVLSSHDVDFAPCINVVPLAQLDQPCNFVLQTPVVKMIVELIKKNEHSVISAGQNMIYVTNVTVETRHNSLKSEVENSQCRGCQNG